ncbi:hypothetical protein C0989_004196, partial [Termitomyces sp. Mn162]
MISQRLEGKIGVWNDLLPYFRKSETFTCNKEDAKKYGMKFDERYYGTSGPLQRTIPRSLDAATLPWINSSKEELDSEYPAVFDRNIVDPCTKPPLDSETEDFNDVKNEILETELEFREDDKFVLGLPFDDLGPYPDFEWTPGLQEFDEVELVDARSKEAGMEARKVKEAVEVEVAVKDGRCEIGDGVEECKMVEEE